MSEQPNISAEETFYVGGWRVDPAAGRISSRGVEHKIEPKAMTVLVCLAQQQGQVVSRETLEAQAWAGMVVGYDSLASAIIKLRKAFGDDSKNPRFIETVPKKGYRLICAVQIATEAPEEEQEKDQQTEQEEHVSAKAAIKSSAKTGKSPSVIMLVAVSLVAVITTVALFMNKQEATVSSKPETQISEDRQVIAVLPFKNLSDDVQQDYFSDGITADLITDLSKISGLSVMARNSVFILSLIHISEPTRQLTQSRMPSWA